MQGPESLSFGPGFAVRSAVICCGARIRGNDVRSDKMSFDFGALKNTKDSDLSLLNQLTGTSGPWEAEDPCRGTSNSIVLRGYCYGGDPQHKSGSNISIECWCKVSHIYIRMLAESSSLCKLIH